MGPRTRHGTAVSSGRHGATPSPTVRRRKAAACWATRHFFWGGGTDSGLVLLLAHRPEPADLRDPQRAVPESPSAGRTPGPFPAQEAPGRSFSDPARRSCPTPGRDSTPDRIMTEAAEPVAVEGGVLALEDYGTLAFESKLRVVDSVRPTLLSVPPPAAPQKASASTTSTCRGKKIIYLFGVSHCVNWGPLISCSRPALRTRCT